MRTLPSIPYAMQKSKSEIVAMRGINFSDALQDGDLAESKNLSARRYPYIATRRARAKQAQYAGCTAMTAWAKLVVVQGTDLLYDGAVRGQVTAGAKQFAVVNTKLVIWPDKVYLDLNTMELLPLAELLTGTGAVFTNNSIFRIIPISIKNIEHHTKQFKFIHFFFLRLTGLLVNSYPNNC